MKEEKKFVLLANAAGLTVQLCADARQAAAPHV